MNKIELNFTPCAPEPPGGYNIVYRVKDSSDTYTDAGNFFMSPAVFYDHINPAGTAYEGIIRSVSDNLICNEIPWNQTVESAPSEPVAITGTVALYCSGSGPSVEGHAGFIFNFSNPTDVNIPVQLAICINGGGVFAHVCYGVTTIGGTLPVGYTESIDQIATFTFPADAASFDTGVLSQVACYDTDNPNYPEAHPKYFYFKPTLPAGYSLALTSPDPQYTIVII